MRGKGDARCAKLLQTVRKLGCSTSSRNIKAMVEVWCEALLCVSLHQRPIIALRRSGCEFSHGLLKLCRLGREASLDAGRRRTTRDCQRSSYGLTKTSLPCFFKRSSPKSMIEFTHDNIHL